MVVQLSHLVGQFPLPVGKCRTLQLLVHGSVGLFWVVSLLVGGSETFGALLGLYPGLLLTGDRRRQIRRLELLEVVESFLVGCRLVLVLHSLSRGCSGSVLSPRSDW